MFTLAAFEGFGAGEVSIQWLIRNRLESAEPRLGSQLAVSLAGSVKSAGRLNENGVSWTRPS